MVTVPYGDVSEGEVIALLKTVAGVYPQRRVELTEEVGDLKGTPVVVTFLPVTSRERESSDLEGEGILSPFDADPFIEGLARVQGVKAVENFSDLLGDFWPKDESADDFIAAVRQWRREGGSGK